MDSWESRVRRVLLVEDDEEDYLFTKELLTELNGGANELAWAKDYRSAIDFSRNGSFDVCLVDYRLGGENGIELAQELIADGHRMPIILLTGQDDPEVDGQAERAGASDFLVKGQITAAMLERAIRYAIQSHAALLQLQDSYRTTVRALAAALELRDDQTQAHATRVTELALKLTHRVAPELAADPQLEYGFLLHDIGKIGVPDAIVLKPGTLTLKETQTMRAHVELGQQILSQIDYLNGRASEIVAAHHERWDGTGYPHGLRENQIPLAARIFAVVDTYDAITNDRPYRQAQSTEHALDEINTASGTQFDPTIVNAFIALMREDKPGTRQPRPVPSAGDRRGATGSTRLARRA
jgi:putative nucleotidyltransferase with HDIG domain